MAVISSIRKRGGLIVTVVGIALFAFVVGDFQGNLFNSQEQNIGEIDGNPISYIAFENEVQRIANIQKERRREAALDESIMEGIRESVWEDFVNLLAIKPQLDGAGLGVSDTEIKELILGNNPDPMVINYFTDPNTNSLIDYFRDPVTGKLKPSSVKIYVDSLPPSEKPRWTEFENLVRESRAQSKYLNLIKKGIHTTTTEAQRSHNDLNRSVDFSWILNPYTSISDSAVKVNDQDLLKYYNENLHKFQQDASVKLEYVIFDIRPTEDDIAQVKNEMEMLAEEWAKITEFREDSFLVIKEADSRFVDTTHFGKDQLFSQIDSIAHQSEVGTILPLFVEDNQYKLCKVTGIRFLPDSVKARHILINVPQGDTIAKALAQNRIDSIKAAVKRSNNFAQLAEQLSDDEGSAKDGGDLGWFSIGKMVPEFQNACFNGKVGDMPIVYSQFGYHLIEILDQSELVRKTSIATVDRLIEPSSKTRQGVYSKAIDFISSYHNSETFQKGIEETGLIKRVADPLKKSDKSISGIDDPKEIIRWAFNQEEGAVSTEPFNFLSMYVIAHVAEVREKGKAPLEQRKEEVTAGARKDKKAKMLSEKMLALGASSIDDYAAKLNLPVNKSTGATFTTYSLPDIGRELKVYGPLFTMKEGQVSGPIPGETGVYVVRVNKITPPPAVTDYSAAKSQAADNLKYRIDAEVIDAIKKSANIEDNRTKFY